MRTLKTITAILPMTLLLACGGGGGGYSSAPAPSIQPTLIQDEANLADVENNGTEAEIAEMENSVDDNDNDFTLTINAASIETARNHQYNSFGDWGLQPGEGGYAHGIDPKTGKLTIAYGGLFSHGTYINDKINQNFNKATYTGNTVARRSNGDIETGSVRIQLKVKNDELKRMDFLFSGTDYDWKKKLKFHGSRENAGYVGGEFGTRKSGFKNGRFRGIRGYFLGDDAGLIMGWFGNKRIGVDRGTFGATKDTIEFK